MRRLIAIIVAALAFGALSGVAAYQKLLAQTAADGGPQWQEIAWPFPRDGWPVGRAFRCMSEACGKRSELYVRAKIGFCNCDAGVADDDEVDRVADLDLISARFVPKQAGRVIHVADMSGRARDYDLKMSDGTQHAATGIALSHRCDLMVAVVQGEREAPELQQMALAFLESDDMHHWMMAAFGGGREPVAR